MSLCKYLSSKHTFFKTCTKKKPTQEIVAFKFHPPFQQVYYKYVVAQILNLFLHASIAF